VEEKKEETVSSVFVSDLEAAVKVFVEKWQDHPEGANALAQKHEAELVRQELQPLVFEEVRLQVDEEMHVLLQNLKVCCFPMWKRKEQKAKEKKGKDYTFQRQFNEKPSIIPGCPGLLGGHGVHAS